MIDVKYGDSVVLKSGEVGKFAGFIGRGHNKILVDLKPSANGRPRSDMVRADGIKEIIRA